MISLPLAQAKNQLSQLIYKVEHGETVEVTRRGKPVAQIVVYPTQTPSQPAEQVQQTFASLCQLRSGLNLEGDIKTIARDGLA